MPLRPPAVLARPGVRRALRWTGRALPLLGIAGGVASLRELHTVVVLPAVLGVLAWTLGNYVASVLRWRSVSGRDLPLRWYARVFAEGELLGLLTPQHAGALYWRARQLRRAGADGPSTAAELTADRLCCGITVVAALLVGGTALPAAVRLAAAGVVVALAVAVAATARLWRPRLPSLQPRRAARWVGYSLLFQAAYVAFALDAVAAVGLALPAGSVVGLLAAAQVASLLPGVHGAGPKEGVLAGGLVALGAPHGQALAVVGLLVGLVWVPALLLGGAGLAGRWLRRRGRSPVVQPLPR